MNNIKGIAIATDGNMKRIAITYDVIDEEGKVTNPNVRVNRVITDSETLSAVDTVFTYAQNVIDAE